MSGYAADLATVREALKAMPSTGGAWKRLSPALAALARLGAEHARLTEQLAALRGEWPAGSDVARLYAGDHDAPLLIRAADTIVGATRLRERWRKTWCEIPAGAGS